MGVQVAVLRPAVFCWMVSVRGVATVGFCLLGSLCSLRAPSLFLAGVVVLGHSVLSGMPSIFPLPFLWAAPAVSFVLSLSVLPCSRLLLYPVDPLPSELCSLFSSYFVRGSPDIWGPSDLSSFDSLVCEAVGVVTWVAFFPVSSTVFVVLFNV